jgi:hypothetical protein
VTGCCNTVRKGCSIQRTCFGELAGHQDLVTTQRYMHVSPAAIESAIRLLDQARLTGCFGDIVETGTETAKSE